MVSRKTGIHPSGRGPKACFWGMLFRIMLLDRLRAEGRAPMRQSVLQHAVPDIAQRLIVEPLDDFHAEVLAPLRVHVLLAVGCGGLALLRVQPRVVWVVVWFAGPAGLPVRWR